MSRPDFPPTAENNQHIVADLKDFSTFKEMRASAAYRKHERALKRLFNKPRIYRSAGVEPRLQAFVRVVVWNIERGSRLAGIIEALNHHPVLQRRKRQRPTGVEPGAFGSRGLWRRVPRTDQGHGRRVEFAE
jgi:hypothetical protein